MEAMRIASEICIYTNDRITIESMETAEEEAVKKNDKTGK
jgi:hypothetical protein